MSLLELTSTTLPSGTILIGGAGGNWYTGQMPSNVPFLIDATLYKNSIPVKISRVPVEVKLTVVQYAPGYPVVNLLGVTNVKTDSNGMATFTLTISAPATQVTLDFYLQGQLVLVAGNFQVT